MPWTAKDAYGHTKKANTPLLQRQWMHVANSELEKHGDEARAIQSANAVVARGAKSSERNNKGKSNA